MKFLALMIMVGIVAVGVFFGLNKFAGTGTHAASTATTAATSPTEAQPAANATAAASEAAPQADASQPAADATPTAPTAADSTSSAADSKDVDQDDLCDADKAAPATTSAAMPGSSDNTGTPASSAAEPSMATTGSAAPAAEPPAAAEAAAPATTVAEAPAATKLAEPQAAPEPAPVTASAPAPEPASEPAKKAPAAAPHRTAKAAPAPAVHHQRVTPSPLIKPAAPAIWWAQGTTSQQGFTLSFAGEASFTKAIVLLFSQPVDAASAATIRVVGKNGTPVSGSWTVSSKNPSLLVFEAPAGTYVLTVPTTVKSTQGTALGRTFGGPLTLH